MKGWDFFMEEKRVFFDRLHDEIGQKLSISPDTVRALRSTLMGHGWNKSELIKYLATVISKKTLSQEQLALNVQANEARLKYGKAVNLKKLEITKTSLLNLTKRIEQYQDTFDAAMLLNKSKMKIVLQKTKMDR